MLTFYNHYRSLSSVTDGRGDAFRHALWNYRMAQALGKEQAKKFADAYEVDGLRNGADRRAVAMDLFNNNVGRNLKPIPGGKL